MSVAEVDLICQFLKDNVKPDLFKIAGGEPTLHPEIDEIIKVIKRYKIANQVRVVSNGLLIHRMSEYFWQEIDQLTALYPRAFLQFTDDNLLANIREHTPAGTPASVKVVATEEAGEGTCCVRFDPADR